MCPEVQLLLWERLPRAANLSSSLLPYFHQSQAGTLDELLPWTRALSIPVCSMAAQQECVCTRLFAGVAKSKCVADCGLSVCSAQNCAA